MRLFSLFFVFSFLPFVASAAVNPDDAADAIRALDWHVGPQTENVASKATLKTDSTLAFLDEGNSKKFLELTGNIPESGNFVLLSTKHNWWATFSFNPLGYVKDDEKIDPDALLQQLKIVTQPQMKKEKDLAYLHCTPKDGMSLRIMMANQSVSNGASNFVVKDR
jgi:uncharacterized membrane-anchored protein